MEIEKGKALLYSSKNYDIKSFKRSILMKYKFSKYNFDFNYMDDRYVFNTKNCGFIKIKKNNIDIFKEYKDKNFVQKNIPSEMFKN